VIVFEAVTVARGEKANFDGMKLGSKLQAVIERLVELTDGLECQSYNLQTIKSHAGVRKKEELLAKAQAVWPEHHVENHDQADALWLLDLAKTNLIAGYETPKPRKSIQGMAF
jgi:hypothetical protein